MKNLSRLDESAVFLIICLLFFPLFVRGNQALEVVINEIAWMGTEVKGIEAKNWWRYEWLELYNNTNQTISLDGWNIELYRTGRDWNLQLKGIIPPKDYFLIVSSEKISPNYDLNYSNLDGKFINSGQKVLLKDSFGNIIDDLDCFSFGKWFAGDKLTKQTMERKNSQLSGNNPENWGTSQNPGGTPKTKNSLATTFLPGGQDKKDLLQKNLPVGEPKPVVYPSGVIINEILPSPEGPDEKEEWIEIFNQNNFEVSLSDWQISDQIGKVQFYKFPDGTKIGPRKFLVLSRPTTKIILNNDGDSLNLFQPDGKIVDSVSYDKAPRGQSYNRTLSGWVWSLNLTPGKENITLSLPKPPEIKKKESPDQMLAAVTETFKQKDSIKKTSKPLSVFLIALTGAIFSAIIILILKMKLKTEGSKNHHNS